MTYTQIATMLSGTGLPFAYYQFPEGTETVPPFICFFYHDSDDFMADDSNYCQRTGMSVELYTKGKDFTSEALVETALKNAGLSWHRSETYLDDEKLYMILFETEVIINGEQD